MASIMVLGNSVLVALVLSIHSTLAVLDGGALSGLGGHGLGADPCCPTPAPIVHRMVKTIPIPFPVFKTIEAPPCTQPSCAPVMPVAQPCCGQQSSLALPDFSGKLSAKLAAISSALSALMSKMTSKLALIPRPSLRSSCQPQCQPTCAPTCVAVQPVCRPACQPTCAPACINEPQVLTVSEVIVPAPEVLASPAPVPETTTEATTPVPPTEPPTTMATTV
jgi:hypothetical protein